MKNLYDSNPFEIATSDFDSFYEEFDKSSPKQWGEKEDHSKRAFLKTGGNDKDDQKTSDNDRIDDINSSQLPKPKVFIKSNNELFDQWIKDSTKPVIAKDDYSCNDQINLRQVKRSANQHIDGIIDLHNLTVSEAKAKMNHFIKKCLAENLECVLIIHGKGIHSKSTPKLKKAVSDFLASQSKSTILRYKQATQKRGGAGATQVWLAWQR